MADNLTAHNEEDRPSAGSGTDRIRAQRSELGSSAGTSPAELLPRYARMLDEALDLADTLANEPPHASAPTPSTTDEPKQMLGVDRPWSHWPGEWEIHQFPGPVANPYVDLLYRDAATHSVSIHDLRALGELPEGAANRAVHIHWTTRLQAGCATAEAAALRTGTALTQLNTWKDRGGRIIWSVHEPLPHDCAFPEVEMRFRQSLADIVDVAHVLHPSTVELCQRWFAIDPATVLLSPHPMYTDVYPQWMSRQEARARLGLRNEFLMVAFGSIRPYKRIDRVISAHQQLRTNDEAPRLIIAGPQWGGGEDSVISTLAASVDGVAVHGHHVADRDVQVLFQAADLIPIAYDDFLNSGVLVLALTFGTPVLAPRNPVTEDLARSHPQLHLWDHDPGFAHAVIEACAQAREPERRAPRAASAGSPATSSFLSDLLTSGLLVT